MQYVVIGLGTFGMKVIQTLTKFGAEVIAIDQDKEKVESVKDITTVSLILDSTDETAMKAAHIENVDAAVLALGDSQEEAILTTVILKSMGIYPIIARAANSLYARVLKLVGADQVIIIEEKMGEEVAKKLLAPGIHEKITLSTDHNLVEIEAQKGFVGKTLKELNIRNQFGVNIIAIQKKITKIDDEGKVSQIVEMNDLPGPDDKIEEGDILVIVGSEADIEKMTFAKEVK
ncbi:TrkA family potassium uptake protein [bacterium]|nr:TrkA family potassium uptake protein [bacterium]RQV96325.1 MAG: TrkA family potassium uptake protein [bacterium]